VSRCPVHHGGVSALTTPQTAGHSATQPPSEGKPIPALQGESPLLGSLRGFQKDRLAFFKRIAHECGEIGSFRVGPYRMKFANSAQFIYSILVEKGANFVVGRRSRVFKAVIGENILAALDGAEHRKHRRLNAPSFQHRRMGGYSIPMVDYADDLQRSWKTGDVLDMEPALTGLTQRIIRKTLFSLEGDVNVEQFSKALHIAEAHLEYMMTHPFSLPLKVPTARNRRVRAAITVIRQTIQAIIDERRQSGKDHGDFLSMLLTACDEDGTRLTDAQVLDHSVLIYIGGHQTSAKILTWALIKLGEHPEVAAKLHHEVDTVLQGRKPTQDDLLRLPYTLQVIKEILRLYPPAYASGRTPIMDIEVCGYYLKKGEPVLFSPYTLHRDPQVFPEPERFDPDRFKPENEKRIPRGAFIPFSAGAHVCIGAQFAMMEMHLVLAHIMQNVSLSVVPGQDIRPVAVGVLGPSSSRMVIQRRREDRSSDRSAKASGI